MDAPSDLTLEILRRAMWHQDGPHVRRLVAARRDGATVLATIDTSDGFNYRAELCTGEKISIWPLEPLRRAVRRALRAHAQKEQPCDS